MSGILQRPKPGETEEDVLALQEQFLESGHLPSAKLVKSNGHEKFHANEKGVRGKGTYKYIYLGFVHALNTYRKVFECTYVIYL